MPDFKSSLISELKFKSREVSSELQETKSIYHIAVAGFCESVFSFCRDNDLENPLEDISAKKKEEEDLNSEFKSLFRKIAGATHPDKTGSDTNRANLEKAVEAKKESKAVDLVNLAGDLNIDIGDLSYDSISYIEANMAKMEKEIDTIHGSYPWIWYYTPDLQKDIIISQFVNK